MTHTHINIYTIHHKDIQYRQYNIFWLNSLHIYKQATFLHNLHIFWLNNDTNHLASNTNNFSHTYKQATFLHDLRFSFMKIGFHLCIYLFIFLGIPVANDFPKKYIYTHRILLYYFINRLTKNFHII